MKLPPAKELIRKYLNGNITPDEKQLVEKFFLEDSKNSTHLPSQKRIKEVNRHTRENLNKHIAAEFPLAKTTRLMPQLAIAATILIFLSAGFYFLFARNSRLFPVSASNKYDLSAGGDKAILTLANGNKINLTEAANGKLAQQGNATIDKTIHGTVTYRNTGAKPDDKIIYNTMSTPRGGTYHLLLADGTSVILNAGSSITFPTSFSGSARTVSITGEVYFEVAHNSGKPFKVITNGQVVEDMGTHFDINAYTDELAIKTTLVEGKVKVSTADHQMVVLSPGQQVQNNGKLTIVIHPDIDEAVAWKDGFFHFNHADIPTVMRALARWYDVDVEYQGSKSHLSFTGDIPRDLKASKALKILSLLNIRFKISGQKIIVIQ